MLAQKLLEAAGNATQPNYIEDVFSTYLYTGTGASQTITNGIDLSTYGGLVWTKTRSSGAGYDWHVLVDSARGVTKVIETNLTDAEATQTDLTSFTTTGYNLAAGSYYGNFNLSGAKFASWTFRKQPKFFDVVTWTGNDTAGRTIAHSLGSVPGCIIVKCYSAAGDNWIVYHQSLGATQGLFLNSTGSAITSANLWNNTSPTDTVFSVGGTAGVNGAGRTYVAYLYAHNAGGFGLTGTDNVISCGSFTTNGSGVANVDLGYEPQWLLVKANAASNDWYMYDTMRGFNYSNYVYLSPNLSAAEGNIAADYLVPTSTGFNTKSFASSTTYIYIAIRRGPMKVPTSGTSVFSPNTYTGNATARSISGLGFPPDLVFPKIRDNGGGFNGTFTDRLRGATNYLVPNDTAAEATNANYVTVLGQDGFSLGTGADVNRNTSTFISWNFRRAPSFFDEVCYKGNNVNSRVLTHNLGVAPELVIIKSRTSAFFSGWSVTTSALPVVGGLYQEALLDATGGFNGGGFRVNIPSTGLTTTTVTLGIDYSYGNESPNTYVMYLFASCPGVSKVGKYTGNGSTQTINCSFTGGARFVLIKRTDASGDWYVWDTARGIVSANDPHLSLNTTAAEITTDDTIDPDSTGFIVNQLSATNVNVSSATYIYLAIA